MHPVDGQPFSVFTDASINAVGAVLIQAGEDGAACVISTASRVLTPAERKFTTCEQELLAIVYALQMFRIYVFGRNIKVHTDNKALSFLRRCILTSNRMARWIMELQDYDLEIIHISGTANYLADALSRNSAGLSAEQISSLTKPRELLVAALHLNINEAVKRELKKLSHHQDADPELQDVKLKVAAEDESVKGRYLIHYGILYRKDHKCSPVWKACVPTGLVPDLVNFVHQSFGHSGVNKCLPLIADSLYIKNLGRKIRKILACCEICQRVKFPNRLKTVKTRSHCPRSPGDLLSVYFFVLVPTGKGGVKFIFVCLDVFSKHVKLYPLRTATTKACLRKIMEHYIPDVTQPKRILPDHGTQFTSPKRAEKLRECNIEILFSPIRHPEVNPVETVMKELGKFFRIYCHKAQKSWPELIPHVEIFLNKTVSTATGYTPLELMFNAPRPEIFSKPSPQLPGIHP
jgi:hypothetical protein